MDKVQILIIGRNAEILRILHRLVNANDAWFGVISDNDEESIKLFSSQNFDLVLLSSGIPEESETFLRSKFLEINPKAKVFQHYGGGSGLLANEINAILGNVGGGDVRVDGNFL